MEMKELYRHNEGVIMKSRLVYFSVGILIRFRLKEAIKDYYHLEARHEILIVCTLHLANRNPYKMYGIPVDRNFFFNR